MKKYNLFLLFAVIIASLLCGFTYIAVQQNIRLSANDPQVQMAEDAAKILEMGKMPQQMLANSQSIDISQSLAPFIVIYSHETQPIVATGFLKNEVPVPPIGVFSYTKTHGENRITWQPQPGTRIASVVVAYKGEHSGFVLVGRSLREVEKREDLLTMKAVVAEIAILIVTLGMYMFLKKKKIYVITV